jgi:hypothetical protein
MVTLVLRDANGLAMKSFATRPCEANTSEAAIINDFSIFEFRVPGDDVGANVE